MQERSITWAGICRYGWQGNTATLHYRSRSKRTGFYADRLCALPAFALRTIDAGGTVLRIDFTRLDVKYTWHLDVSTLEWVPGKGHMSWRFKSR